MSKMHSPLSEEREFRLALIQLMVGKNKAENVTRACKFVAEAAKKGAKIVALPECCNSPYGNTYFPEYAESIPGTTTESFSKAARDNNIYLVAGSIPEKEDGKLFNTCTVFDPTGAMVAKYRKTHLFDIDIPGKITFQESKTLTPGNSLATFDTPFCKVGLGICYDMRFAELAMLYARKDCQLLLFPGAFNMTTGPAHWELLQQARAVDNQVFVGAISPARDETASYVAWGHTTLVNPWGEVSAKADEVEQIVYADIDLDFLGQVRNQVPITKQRRDDLYTLEEKSQ